MRFSTFREAIESDGIAVLSAEIPADLLTPAAVFLRLGGDRVRCSFLFESVETGGAIGRYSFIGIDPAEEIRLSATRGVHRIGHQRFPFNPGELSNVIRSRLPAPKRRRGLPVGRGMAGGWVGYFGYDWVRFLERLPVIAEAVHKAPWVWLGLYDEIVVFDHVHQTAQVNLTVRPLEKGGRSVLRQQYDDACRRLDRTMQRLRRPQRPDPVQPVVPRPVRTNMSRRTFVDGVRAIKRHISRGDIFQCVLSQRFTVMGHIRPFDVYRRLRRANPSPYLYFLKCGSMAIAGSSPETLVRKTGRRIITRPIAGTRPRGDNHREDLRFARQLLNSPKENAEHVMLVDLGRNDLGRVCRPGSVTTEEFRRIDYYSHVMHMVSQVEGDARRTVDALDVLAATFPAGTVTGAPKIRAMEIIESLEPERRGIYAGCVGYIDWWGNLDTAIAIRTAVVEPECAHTQAGAGIVADSDPLREYRETQNKAAAPLAAIGGRRPGGHAP